MSSPLQTIKSAYDQHMRLGLDDRLIVDCFVAVMTAAFHRGLSESNWMYFIAPPGSGKTETVMPMLGHPRVVMLTTPTENCFMSGSNDDEGNDPSLLPLLDGNLLIWKDYTAMMDNRAALIDKINGELRDVYDQYCSKASGKIGFREYNVRFGMIACVTDKIDQFAESHQQLGQRFLSFRINRVPQTHAERVENLKVIVDSMGRKRSWQSELKTTVQTQVNAIIKECASHPRPTFDKDIDYEIRVMADLLALARTVPNAETATRPEIASRIVQQFVNIGHAHAIADGRSEWNETELQLIRRVLKDSLSLVRQRLLLFLYRQGKHRPSMPTDRLVRECGSSKKEMNLILMQYVFSGVIEAAGGTNEDPWWRLTPDIYQSIDKVGVLR